MAIIAQAQNYGIVEVYYDTPNKVPSWGFSHYQSLMDTTITWSSYSWYWMKQFDSKQWVQYWLSSRFAIGTEIEFYHEDLTEKRKLEISPRVGIQFKVW